MGITPAAAEMHSILGAIKADLASVANHPLLTADIGTIVDAMAELSPDALKEQLRHQLTLARHWHRTATKLAEGAEAAAEREAAAFATAAGAHSLVANANQMAAAALSLAAARRP